MRLRWTSPASADLESIKTYLDANQPHLSHSTVRRLYDAVLSLKAMPQRGRRGRIEGTREMLFRGWPYIVVYRVTEQAVEILRIYHGAQDWP